MLKEKGFNEPCIGSFNIWDTFIRDTYDPAGTLFINTSFRVIKNEESVAAPLWQQVIDWLREKHIAIIELPFTNRYGVAHKFKGAEESTFLGGYTKEKAIEKALTLI